MQQVSKSKKERTMKKKTSRANTTNEATSAETNFLLAIMLVSAISLVINFAVEVFIAKPKDNLTENHQQAEQVEIQQQLEQVTSKQNDGQIAGQQEVIYVAYSNIKRKIGSDEKRELQRMLREMSYTEVIPSTGYKKFDCFMCELYTHESERGTVEIFVNPKREALIQLHKDDDVQIVDIIDNIDYTIGRTLPEESIIFHNATWIADENGMNKWEFGKKTLITEETFKEYENTTLSIIRDKIIVSSGERILELDEDSCVELLTDCKNGQYKFFNHSLFYINRNYDLVEYNLLTGEITKIDSEVYLIKGEIRVRYKVINDFEDRFIPGYIDKEGNRRRFTDYEIDEKLIMTVNQ